MSTLHLSPRELGDFTVLQLITVFYEVSAAKQKEREIAKANTAVLMAAMERLAHVGN